MDLMKIGTDLLMSKLGANGADSSQVTEMLGGLLGGGDAPDLGGLLSSLQGGGAADAVSSWLGSGENQPLDTGVLSQALDGDKLAGMASKLGVEQNDLLGGLSDMRSWSADAGSAGRRRWRNHGNDWQVVRQVSRARSSGDGLPSRLMLLSAFRYTKWVRTARPFLFVA